ncbi:PrgI family protein [Candidatus Kaiserbacteria bacterium]|nr:PrgI family protein [Candidatus Kaiserbacteria bacterium]
MRFEVPQFIDVEDKIFGPFTWKQFVYIAGGAGAGIMLYMTLPFPLFIVVAGPIGALAAGLAFYPVNNRPLALFLEAVVHYISSTRLYIWKKQDTPPVASSPEGAPPIYTLPTTNKIASLSRQLELNALQKGLPKDPGDEPL